MSHKVFVSRLHCAREGVLPPVNCTNEILPIVEQRHKGEVGFTQWLVFDTGSAVIDIKAVPFRRWGLRFKLCPRPHDNAGTAEAAAGGGPFRRPRGSPSRKRRAEKWTLWRETPKDGEMLAYRAIECWPSEYPAHVWVDIVSLLGEIT